MKINYGCLNDHIMEFQYLSPSQDSLNPIFEMLRQVWIKVSLIKYIHRKIYWPYCWRQILFLSSFILVPTINNHFRYWSFLLKELAHCLEVNDFHKISKHSLFIVFFMEIAKAAAIGRFSCCRKDRRINSAVI